ncbi:MAG TPA: S41 family peptidase [Bacteroidales bacterium]|nr:S41 family peptidase [Bacteroidales bacterium]
MSRLKIYLPITFALILALGILLGYRMNPGGSPENKIFQINHPWSSENKVLSALNYIDQNYVDSVDLDELEKEALVSVLTSLDPHSQYIPAEAFNEMNDALKGKFEGIGVQFRIEKDTVMVIAAISGGPSEKVGIRGGDRIVTVNGDTIAGTGVSNEDVIGKLKGERGTEVQVGVFRRGVDELLYFTITRDVIPTYSVDIAFVPVDSTGYIKLSKFSATTYQEMKSALDKLQQEGINKLILDLRGNSGGYLQAAINLSDEFLKDEELIVYTEGKNRPRKFAYATEEGSFENKPIAILIDEGSASASEIVAGAVQDNDRGIIAGRRSFGKGLVQEQIRFNDRSALRLTVARYYTPTGRSIQRPYANGKKDYYHDLYERWSNGEMVSADSIHFNDSLIYTTPKGDTVYGGGGIMPDVFVSVNKEQSGEYVGKLLQKGLFYRFAFDYVDKNRPALKAYENADVFVDEYQITDKQLKLFFEEADNKGVKRPEEIDNKELQEIKILLKALIGRNLFDNEGFYPVYLKSDVIFKEAINALNSGEIS